METLKALEMRLVGVQATRESLCLWALSSWHTCPYPLNCPHINKDNGTEQLVFCDHIVENDFWAPSSYTSPQPGEAGVVVSLTLLMRKSEFRGVKSFAGYETFIVCAH